MTLRRLFIAGAALLAPALLYAQATTQHAASTATQTATSQMTGEVLYVNGNVLVVKMKPGGEIRKFDVPPGRQFMIDGKPKMLGELEPGTVVKAKILTTIQDVRVRTLSVVKGTVWWVEGTSVILTLENGENRLYTARDSMDIKVNGQPATVGDLRKGQQIVASKLVEEPQTVIATDVAVTGEGPGVGAQTTTRHAAGSAQETTSQMTGEVVYVEGNLLVVKMMPSNEIRSFNVPPSRRFMINGQAKTVADLKPGTVLNATVVTKTQDVRVRTQTIVKGTVLYVAAAGVVLKLEDGVYHLYSLSDSGQLTADGKPVPAAQLKKGMKVVGSQMVEEPETVITTDVTVTGKAPD